MEKAALYSLRKTQFTSPITAGFYSLVYIACAGSELGLY